MNRYVKAVCFRCGRPMEGKFYEPCPHCAREGVNVNYRTLFDLRGAVLPPQENGQPGIYRFRDHFALPDDTPAISIGEGSTPLRRLDRLGKKLGLRNLYMKDESKNPVMSHKDRMCSLMVTLAKAQGAPGMVIGSTGNQGASVAAYAAAAELPCVIFTTPNVSASMKVLMQVFGASVFVTENMEQRDVILGKVVHDLGFIPASGIVSPPMGSNCFALDAYKTIAFEVYEQLGDQVPDWFIVPISYGDTMYGVYKGMCELREMGCVTQLPHFAAAEVFGAVENTIKAGAKDPIPQPSSPSIQTSIATGYAAYHTVQAVLDSQGEARSSHDEEALAMQKLLAQTEGVFAETASVASLVVAGKLLKEKRIKPDDTVVVLITSTGVKTPETASQWLPVVPVIHPTLEDLREKMQAAYGREL